MVQPPGKRVWWYFKPGLTLWFSNFLPKYLPERTGNNVTETAGMCVAALLVRAQTGNSPRPASGWTLGQRRGMSAVHCCPTVERNEALVQATWTNPEDSQQRSRMVWFQVYEMLGMESRLVFARHREKGTASGHRGSFWSDENILELGGSENIHLCEYTRNHWIIHSKMLNFCYVNYISRTKNKKHPKQLRVDNKERKGIEVALAPRKMWTSLPKSIKIPISLPSRHTHF